MCNCPTPLPPPNDKIKRCRLILQILSIGLVILSIMSIVMSSLMTTLIFLMLVFVLYMSWAQFNWCFTLIFFLFAITYFIQAAIMIIGMIQYHTFTYTDPNDKLLNIYNIMLLVYFTPAIYFSHYSYKHFKALSMEPFPQFINQGNAEPQINPNQYQDANINYRRVQDPPQSSSNVFQGRGVRIG